MLYRIIPTLLLALFLAPKPLPAQLEDLAPKLAATPTGRRILGYLKIGETDNASKLLRAEGTNLDSDEVARLSKVFKTQNSAKLALAARQVYAAALDFSLPSADPVTIKALEDVTGSKARIALVPDDVKRFIYGFAAGAQMTDAQQARLIEASPGGPVWLQTPKEKRRFVIGTRDDAASIYRYIDDQKAEGYVCFFYLLCEDALERYCENEVVGSYMRTAGRVDVAMSAKAQAKSMILREIGAAQTLRAGEFALVLISPNDILNQASGAYAQVLISQHSSSTEQ